MSLPVVYLSGTAHDQGLGHGEALKERVLHNLAVYFDRFEREAKLPRGEVLRRASLYRGVMEERDPEYCAGMQGIARGAGCDYLDVVALNVRYEILYHQYTQKALADECTSFAVLPEASADRHLLIGQNWDWIPQVEGAVLRTDEPDGLRIAAFTEAGIFGGKIGLNSAGLGLAINGLISASDDWSRLSRPFHVRCWAILRSPRFEDAVRVVTDEERACSTNFLIAQAPDRVVDIEAAPGSVRSLSCVGGCLAHANHFEDPAALGVEQPITDRSVYSLNRSARFGALLQEHRPLDVSILQDLLRNHEDFPNAICRHPDESLRPEERSITVTGVVMDLNAGVMHISDRQPCLSPFRTVSV